MVGLGPLNHLGIADNYNAAWVLAEAKQAEWLKFRERPTICLDVEQVSVILQAQLHEPK